MPQPDPNAPLRSLLDRWTDRPQGPSGGVATTPHPQHARLVGPPTGRQAAPTTPRPAPATSPAQPPRTPPCAPPPARGDVVCWSHHGHAQIGVVQNIAPDGRAWLRTLDYLDRAVPQPVDALTVLATRHQLTAEARRRLLDPQDRQ